MSAPSIRLVDRGKPGRVSGVEIHALTQERVAAFKAKRQEEREAQESEIAAWRKRQATKARRKTSGLYVLAICIASVGLGFAGEVIGALAFVVLLSWALWLGVDAMRKPYERFLARVRQ